MKIPIGKCPFDIERLEREVNILFVSDLHYDHEKNTDKRNLEATDMNKKLVESIKAADYDWEPDIVIVGGDLVNRGEEKNYAFYFDLIKKLTDEYDNLRHTIYSTPGNHDVTRTDMTTMHPIIQKLHGPIAKKSHTVNYTVGMFHTLSKRNITNTPLVGKFRKFEELYFKTYLEQRKKLEKEYNISPLKVSYPVAKIFTTYYTSVLGLNLVCHNSSFFCDMGQTGDDRNNLFIIRDLVDKVNVSIPKIGPVICFMHHPYHFLHESEYIAPLEAVKKPEQNNFSRILETSDVVLSGHVHGELQDPTYQQHHAYVITNGTSYTTDKWKNKSYPFTYAILKVNKQGNWFGMKKFVYNRKAEEFQLRAPEVSPHYHFNHRSNAGLTNDTSLEAEKLRVVKYFLELEKEDDERINTFFVYQLGLYDKQFKQEGKEVIEFEFEDIKSLGFPAVLIVTAGKPAAWIYKINKNPYANITNILERIDRVDIPKKVIIYFSISRQALITDGELHIQRIDALWADYRSLVLLSKKENISVNLLYH